MHKILSILAAAVLLVTFAAPASAARNAQAAANKATLTVNPGAPTVGSSLAFAGCGYEAGVDVSVVIVGLSATTIIAVAADPDGCFNTESVSTFPVNDVGSYEAKTYQGRDRKAEATLTFNVT